MASQDYRLIITIDGPSGVGKSTVAKRLASHLGYTYLDSGALYRAVAWKVKASQVDPNNTSQIEALLPSTQLELTSCDHMLVVLVDSQDVTQDLRSLAIGQLASSIAALSCVREWLLPIQRNFGEMGGVIAEGRDMGTQVFPHADVKFFLDADPAIRTSRRHGELPEEDQSKNLNDVKQEILMRDARDRSRDIAPLVAATDAVTIDTSSLSIDQVVERMLEVVATRQ